VAAGPAALRLVDDQHALGRCRAVGHRGVAKLRQRLDHRRHPPPRRVPVRPAGAGVAHQRLAQDLDERGVAGQERGPLPRREGEVEAAQRLARTGRAGHEHDRLGVTRARVGKCACHRRLRAPQPARPGAGQPQRLDAMRRIQRASGVEQARDRRVVRLRPRRTVAPERWEARNLLQQPRQREPARLDHRGGAGQRQRELLAHARPVRD